MTETLGESVKPFLKFCGENVRIYPLSKIVKPEVIEIGDYSMVDDFTFIYGGKWIKIGRYVHIETFVSIIGGGELTVGDYAVIATGARILTGTDTYHNRKRMSTALPLEQRNVVRGKVVIEKDAFIGTNVVVHPNVAIGEGSVIGSCSLVTKDVEPWTIHAGIPAHKIGVRPPVDMKDL